MINLFLSRSSRNLAYHSINSRRCYHVGKAGSVHTAIKKALRKSRGMGFRGSEGKGGALDPDDPREKYRVEHDIPRYEKQPVESTLFFAKQAAQKNRREKKGKKGNRWEGRGKSQSRQESRGRWEGSSGVREGRGSKRDNLVRSGSGEERDWNSKSYHKPGGPEKREAKWGNRGGSGRPAENRTSTHSPADLRIRIGKRLLAGEEDRKEDYNGKTSRFGHLQPSYSSNSDRYSNYAVRGERNPETSSRFRDRNTDWSGRKRAFGARISDRSEGEPSPGRALGRPIDGNTYGSRVDERNGDRYPSLSFQKRPSESKFADASSKNARSWNKFENPPERTSSDRSTKYGNKSSFEDVMDSPRRSEEVPSSRGPKFVEIADKRIPLSIPYTTPASEFLYGASVVEAALKSTREPRRKLYKMYIYNGENREDAETDARLEILARRKGVDVVKAGRDWLRVMDKMSGGRPHNGYILEASPLPRLPVTSLGQLTTVNEWDGFEVSVDYQSREEAEVNGTSTFYKTTRTRSGRKPLVLLLDSIVDPGNLGGIIRTASFLGVSAIAISARNSASFTPVVLKASAGASEDITLFTVNKPSGFVVASKNAGWKVFAAVAPSKNKYPAMPASISTDELNDPLLEDPCIIMLGSEGEGLRENLRNKADVELFIEGSRYSHGVDSLNVSVAAGILCNAFLGRHRPMHAALTQQIQQEQEKETAESTGKLF